MLLATTSLNNNNINISNHINANTKNAAYTNYASAATTAGVAPTAAKRTATNYHLVKSNSYSGTSECNARAALEAAFNTYIQPHSVSQADSLITLTVAHDMLKNTPPPTPPPAKSLYNSPAHTCIGLNTTNADADMECTEYDAFLINNVNGSGSGSGATAGGSSGSSGARRSSRSYASKMRASCCLRTHAFISRNWYLSYLVPISILGALMFVAYLMRDYAKDLLFWIETQNPWIVFVIYLVLFSIVSFPIVVGYFVLLVTAGYLFGCLKGWFTVILGANLGIALAHWTMRSLRHRMPMQKLIKNETGRAILRVISGPRAFKVVLFTRLTPIPFGLQNAIFGISTINLREYHMATFLGLLPAQTINVYLGSTLRSMQEVLDNEDTKLTGYISFVFEVICGIALMFWVVQKARKELSETLLTDISNDGKHIDIQV